MSRKRKSASDSTANNKKKPTSQFLIDGKSPIEPNPKLIAAAAATNYIPNNANQQGPGRHRSLSEKGLILELIDEVYPPLVCPGCHKTNNLRTDADQHLKAVHKGQKYFCCVSSDCEQVYASKPGLRYHIEHAHRVSLINENQR
ncbi:MAG: hypothetical protein EXX96DRAFT_5117 [Benjaminiella poitrasii]|nr:MAG: hypothetical protein EXX96DRAFT_5117 [Benjaminiella poitrasii]